MDSDVAGTLGAWTVVVVGFLGLAGFLSTRGELTPLVVVLYWFPPVVLTLVGILPPPWDPLV